MIAPGSSAASTEATCFLGLDAGATHVRAQAFVLESGLRPAGPVHRAKFPAYRPSGARGRPEAAPWLNPDWHESEEAAAGRERADLAVELLATAAVGFSRVALTAAWPGLKDEAGDSIVYAVNGPRIHCLRQHLEAGLASRGVPLVTPMAPLQSDGDMAGWGEELASEGGFRGTERAYLLLVGTGLAEAFKDGGRIVPRSSFPGALAPYAMTAPNLAVDFEKILCTSAWLDGEDGLGRPERLGYLRAFLELRLELAPFETLVLGGRFTQILQRAEIDELAQAGLPVQLSRLQDPALWGCAAFSLNRQQEGSEGPES